MSRSLEELEACWTGAPRRGTGAVELIVVRKGGGAHETPQAVELSRQDGVVGDRWSAGSHPATCQVTLMNVDAARVVAGARPLHLPGDNFLVDLDLSEAALPVGARLRVGTALLEVSDDPHLGCKKFAERFGVEALKWVNGKARRERRLRGINCRILEPGRVAVGDRAAVVE